MAKNKPAPSHHSEEPQDATDIDTPQAPQEAQQAPEAAAPEPQEPQAPEAPQEAPQPVGHKLTPIGKITVKTVFGAVDMKKLPPLRVNLSDENPEGDPNPNPEKRVCRIVGYADGVKRGDSTYGEWAALTGEFAATNADTGEIFASKTAIIPGAMGEALVSTTEDKLRNDASAKVRFSCDVFIKRSARQPAQKYEYIVRPVIDAKLSSPALELLALSE